MPDGLTEHDELKRNTQRIESLEGKVKGVIPEQCIEIKLAVASIKEDVKSIKGGFSKLGWAILIAIIGIFANLIANNIRWDHAPQQTVTQAMLTRDSK